MRPLALGREAARASTSDGFFGLLVLHEAPRNFQREAFIGGVLERRLLVFMQGGFGLIIHLVNEAGGIVGMGRGGFVHRQLAGRTPGFRNPASCPPAQSGAESWCCNQPPADWLWPGKCPNSDAACDQTPLPSNP